MADVVVDDRFAAEDDIENGIMNLAESDKNVDSHDNDEAIQRSCDVGIQEATYDNEEEEEEEVDDTNNGNVIDNDTIPSQASNKGA